jgi:hypothetical protein
VRFEERTDLWECGNEVSRQDCERDLADDDQQSHPMISDRAQLIRLVANAAIVRYGNKPVCADEFEPDLIRSIMSKSVVMSFDSDSICCKHLRKGPAEIAVREEAMAQAARS